MVGAGSYVSVVASSPANLYSSNYIHIGSKQVIPPLKDSSHITMCITTKLSSLFILQQQSVTIVFHLADPNPRRYQAS